MTTFTYHASDGSIHGYVDRRPGKDFRQRNERGEDKGPEPPHPLYRLPELEAEDALPVLIVEGEKCADIANERLEGFAATTSIGGAGNPSKTDWAPLKGRHVLIWPDNDAKGEAYAHRVAAQVAMVRAASVSFVAIPPALPRKGDIEDAVDLDLDLDCIITDTAPVHVGGFKPLSWLIANPPPPLEWLVAGMLPLGWSSLLFSVPKAGKTTYSRARNAAVSRGMPFLGRETKRGTVLEVSLEDPPRTTFQHYMKLGADPDNLFIVGDELRDVPKEDRLELLETAIRFHRPLLVTIDTLQKFLLAADLDHYAAMVQQTDPFVKLCRRYGCTIETLHHGRKSGGNHGAASLGSQAVIGGVDLWFEITRQQNGNERYLAGEGRGDVRLDRILLKYDPETGGLSDGLAAPVERDMAIPLSARIWAWLFAQDGPRTLTEIRRHVTGGNEQIAATLRAMVAGGEITNSGGTYEPSVRPSP